VNRLLIAVVVLAGPWCGCSRDEGPARERPDDRRKPLVRIGGNGERWYRSLPPGGLEVWIRWRFPAAAEQWITWDGRNPLMVGAVICITDIEDHHFYGVRDLLLLDTEEGFTLIVSLGVGGARRDLAGLIGDWGRPYDPRNQRFKSICILLKDGVHYIAHERF
jgi:hypothetical protein